MKVIPATQFFKAFFVATAITLLWSAVAAYLRSMPFHVGFMTVIASLYGLCYAVIFLAVHLFGARISLWSSFVSALLVNALWVYLATVVGTFAGWSVLSVSALLLLSGLIAFATCSKI